MEGQLKLARELQAGLLPRLPPDVAGYDMAGANLPTWTIGGDYYDWVLLDGGRLGLVERTCPARASRPRSSWPLSAPRGGASCAGPPRSRASSQRPGWPLTYRLLFLAVACWAGSDGAETLHWAGLLPRFAGETVLNWLWLPPFIALFLVARLRHAAPAIEEARAAEDSAPAPLHVSRGPLLLQAALLPALHILLKNLGAIDAETLDWREACAFVTFLVLTILALVYQRSIESQHQQLVAARVHAAEAATRAKSQFLATMSHELRTPMNGVLGATDVLLQTGLTDHQRRLAEILRVSAQALLNIVNDILDFSHRSGLTGAWPHESHLRE